MGRGIDCVLMAKSHFAGGTLLQIRDSSRASDGGQRDGFFPAQPVALDLLSFYAKLRRLRRLDRPFQNSTERHLRLPRDCAECSQLHSELYTHVRRDHRPLRDTCEPLGSMTLRLGPSHRIFTKRSTFLQMSLMAAHSMVEINNVGFDLISQSVLWQVGHSQHVKDCSGISVAPLDYHLYCRVQVGS